MDNFDIELNEDNECVILIWNWEPLYFKLAWFPDKFLYCFNTSLLLIFSLAWGWGKVNQMYLLCISDIPGHIWDLHERKYISNNFPFSRMSVLHLFSSSVKTIFWESKTLYQKFCSTLDFLRSGIFLPPLLVWWVIESPIYHQRLSPDVTLAWERGKKGSKKASTFVHLKVNSLFLLPLGYSFLTCFPLFFLSLFTWMGHMGNGKRANKKEKNLIGN